MKCIDPFVKAGQAFACGRCLPCKFRSRRIWFHRVLLEASQHDYSTVVTLTYDDAAVPESGDLQPEHLRNWLKRFRARSLERYPWRYVRFIAVAEYGEKTGRPHYHVVIFGLPGCEFGRNGRQWCGDCSCLTCSDVQDTWGLGVCSLQSLDPASAAYVSGYVTRKLLQGTSSKRVAPFMRMSNKPGIGVDAMWDVASSMIRYSLDQKEVPVALAHGKKALLLGRHLRKKLHEFLAKEVSEQTLAPAYVGALQAVRDYAFDNGLSQAQVYRQLNEAGASQLEQAERLKERVL